MNQLAFAERLGDAARDLGLRTARPHGDGSALGRHQHQDAHDALAVHHPPAAAHQHARVEREPFDLVVLDPPRFAKTPFGTIDVVRDYQSLFKPALLTLADDLEEMKTICRCGRKATMVVRVGADGLVERDGAQIEIGGNERYVPLCRRHFYEARRERLGG